MFGEKLDGVLERELILGPFLNLNLKMPELGLVLVENRMETPTQRCQTNCYSGPKSLRFSFLFVELILDQISERFPPQESLIGTTPHERIFLRNFRCRNSPGKELDWILDRFNNWPNLKGELRPLSPHLRGKLKETFVQVIRFSCDNYWWCCCDCSISNSKMNI